MWSAGSRQTAWPAPAPAPGAEWCRRKYRWSELPGGCAVLPLWGKIKKISVSEGGHNKHQPFSGIYLCMEVWWGPCTLRCWHMCIYIVFQVISGCCRVVFQCFVIQALKQLKYQHSIKRCKGHKEKKKEIPYVAWRGDECSGMKCRRVCQ